MPYRRLPNTDQARIRALKSAIGRSDAYNTGGQIISFNTLSEARNFLSKFEIAHNYFLHCYENQIKGSPRHQANVKKARLYISHFIQVLNFSVIRSEVKSIHKKLYDLSTDDYTVPDLTSEMAIADWGKKIIEGEKKRIAQGGAPIFNPTIAKVKVHYDIFIDGYERQKALQTLASRSLENLALMRARADELILDTWNQVEVKFRDISPNESRLNSCRDYGVVYYYRAGEQRPE